VHEVEVDSMFGKQQSELLGLGIIIESGFRAGEKD
jgi:hypothetical protein